MMISGRCYTCDKPAVGVCECGRKYCRTHMVEGLRGAHCIYCEHQFNRTFRGVMIKGMKGMYVLIAIIMVAAAFLVWLN